ncbi:MAG: gamma-glutamyl-gamma-aminobutyrate hydrolase family protein [Candidatus Microbacterium colombiense]|nr:MAG: gamma-glutamyl-gamma-aminobutyrate hydrolase family protein [Microbacterium sp.]
MSDASVASPGEPRPIIGVTTYRQAADWGAWKQIDADLLPSDYARSVERAGGIPILVPPLADRAAARAVLGRLDGLLIAGGADVNPARYGQDPDPHVTRWDDDRDASELWLLAEADAVRLPVLGICRGMQIMAVASGGSLIQHLPDVVGHERHGGGESSYEALPVGIAPGNRLAEALGAQITSSSHHHQAVADHPGFVATAHDDDGVLQAMESEGERFAVGVQWHPETTDDVRVIAALVKAAGDRAARRDDEEEVGR